MTVVAPRAPVIPETNPITLRSTVYGLYEEPEVCLLRTLGRQNDEVMFTMPPDIRPKSACDHVKRTTHKTHGKSR